MQTGREIGIGRHVGQTVAFDGFAIVEVAEKVSGFMNE